jgi:hypothetical protein
MDHNEIFPEPRNHWFKYTWLEKVETMLDTYEENRVLPTDEEWRELRKEVDRYTAEIQFSTLLHSNDPDPNPPYLERACRYATFLRNALDLFAEGEKRAAAKWGETFKKVDNKHIVMAVLDYMADPTPSYRRTAAVMKVSAKTISQWIKAFEGATGCPIPHQLPGMNLSVINQARMEMEAKTGLPARAEYTRHHDPEGREGNT